MEIVAWRCKYLLEIAKNRAQNCLIFCLDETCFNLKFSVSKGKRVVTCYADFADNAFFFEWKGHIKMLRRLSPKYELSSTFRRQNFTSFNSKFSAEFIISF